MTSRQRTNPGAGAARNPAPSTITFTWDDAARQFQTHLEAALKSRETVAVYNAAIRQAQAFIARLGLADDMRAVRREHLEMFFADLGKRVSPATVLNRRKGLNAFFKWLLAEGEITRNPLEHVPWPEQEDKAPKALSVDEVKAILAACSKSFLGRRRAALVAFMVDTGWRSSAVRAVTVEMVQERGVIRVPTKGRREVQARLTPPTQAYLDRYLRARRSARGSQRPELWLTTTGRPMSRHDIWEEIHNAGLSVGIPGLYPHALRHTHAIWWLEEGGNIADLQENLGHSDLRVTKRYLRFMAQERAMQARQRYGPGNRLGD